MPTTHADLAARLLRDAAAFFEVIGAQNEPLKDQMRDNATVFRQVADLVAGDPYGVLSDRGEEGDSDKGIRGQFG